MKKPSTKAIWIVDDTVCDLLIHDTQVDRACVQGQAEQEPERPQFILSVDPYTRSIMACRLSSEEETKAEH